MRQLFILSSLFLCFTSAAQESQYQSFILDKSITVNSDAIIRFDETDIELLSYNKMIVKRHIVITILRKAGNKAITNYAYYDSNTDLKSLEALFYDTTGKQIEKIKKKDFQDVSAVSGGTLYSDSRVKYFDYTPISYPYTVDFQFSYETSNTAFIPPWNPIDDYRVSVEKSSYHLINHKEVAIREFQKNFEGYDIERSSTPNSIYYTVSNIHAIRKESLAPSMRQAKPNLLLSLNKFHLEGVDGYGDNWKSFGKWQYDKLLTGRDNLSSSTISTIDRMVKGLEDPIEKAKVIYEYVQNNTRYISVQLGIGGWMPISAEEVDRVKYGDCKGLTNYTKALLKSQGIESYYSVVYAGEGKRDIEKDFASMQGNHVILNIPDGDNDIWLECTSQTMPFGFLGDFTDDRNVLVISSEGGQIKHTPVYKDYDNKKFTNADVVLNTNGSISAEVAITSKGIAYDNRSTLERLPHEKKNKHYKEYWKNINGLRITEMKSSNNTALIEYTEQVKIEAESYGTKAGDDLLFKMNIFAISDFVPSRYRNRKQPFEITRGFENEDRYSIALPETYMISQLPLPINITNKFGTLSVNFIQDEDDKIVYERKLLIKKGKYSKEEYQEYRNFRKSVNKTDNIKLILTK